MIRPRFQESLEMTLTLASKVVGNGARVLDASSGNLPVTFTPLVGRRDEVVELRRRLRENRLVTLLGPGGVGKTRLAAETARSMRDLDGAQVHWVELAPVTAEGVDLAVAYGVGVHDAAGLTPSAAIVDALGNSNAVLVLDNAEHVVTAVAKLSEQLLASCGGLRIVATSRETLGVPGEVVWRVEPLGVPGSGQGLEAMAQCDAVELFVQRARSAFTPFDLNVANAEAVARICQQLDGLPLAIELAVANLRTLPVQDVASSLDNVFGFLVGGPRTSPARHQTLRAALDWSQQLLTEDEKELLRRLSVFVGPFGLEAASRVAVPGGDGSAAFDALRRLVDKSLVVAEIANGKANYRLLATVRQYAAEQLSAAGEEELCRQAHLGWCLRRAVKAEPRLAGPTQAVELNNLEGEINDIRAALNFARQEGDARAVLEIAGALGLFWYLHGHYSEGREWLDWAVVTAPGAPETVRAKALRASGYLAFLQCDYPAAVERLTAGLRLFKRLKDDRGMASTLQRLGGVAREQGRYPDAERHHMESMALFEAVGDRWGVASAHGYLGFASWLQGDTGRAKDECRQALELFRGLDDAEGTAWSLLSLGVVARIEGDVTAAEELLGKSKAISEEIGFKEGIAWCFNELGLVAGRRGGTQAETLLRKSLEIHRELGDKWRQTSVLEDLASSAVLNGDPRTATALLGAAEAARSKISTPIPICEQADHAATVLAARKALGQEEFDHAFEQGKTASLDEIVRRLTTPTTGSSADRTEGLPEQRPQGDRLVKKSKKVATEPAHSGRSGSGPGLLIRALGHVEVRVNGDVVEPADWGYSKPRELFFLLCSSLPRTRDQLGLALWPDLSNQQLRNALHSAMRDMRRALGAREWVTFGGGCYSFNAARPHRYDVSEFETALAQARRLPGPQALPHLQKAISTYGGDFLEGVAASEWADVRRRELRANYEMALGATGAILANGGQFRQAVQIYERAVAHEPLDEAAHRELMKCWSRLGEPARALRHYQRLQDILRKELGSPPAPETARVYESLRVGAQSEEAKEIKSPAQAIVAPQRSTGAPTRDPYSVHDPS
jgi:predicted ATPase/two-component SAPR family response regulator